MVALDNIAGNALAPYRRPDAPQAAGADAATGNRLARFVQDSSQRLAQGPAGGATEGVIAQISDMARSFLDQVHRSGASSASFDLHMDLEQLGVRVDGRGGRSGEGHSLSVDLHIETTRGKMQTENGMVEFESLEISYSIEEMHAQFTSGPALDDDLVGATQVAPPDPGIGPVDGQPNRAPARPGKALLDGLKQLVSILDNLAKQMDKQELSVDDLLNQGTEEMNELLKDIGEALEKLGQRREGRNAGEEVAFEAYRETTEVRLQSLRFVRAPEAAPAPRQVEGTTDVAESAGIV